MDTFRGDPPHHERATATPATWRQSSRPANAKRDLFWSFGHGEYIPAPEPSSEDMPPTEADLAMEHLIARLEGLTRRSRERVLGLACWLSSSWTRERGTERGR